MNPPIAIVLVRMRRLPRRLRIAHLRGLLRLQPAGCPRGERIAALLRAEMNVPPVNQGRAS